MSIGPAHTLLILERIADMEYSTNDMHRNSVHRLRERGAAGRLVPHAECSVPATGLSANSAGARRRLRHVFTVLILLPAVLHCTTLYSCCSHPGADIFE